MVRAPSSACDDIFAKGQVVGVFHEAASDFENLERAGVPRSAAMAMVGHKTEAVYRRYAIVDEVMLQESAAKLAILERSHGRSGTSSGTSRQKSAAPFLVTM